MGCDNIQVAQPRVEPLRKRLSGWASRNFDIREFCIFWFSTLKILNAIAKIARIFDHKVDHKVALPKDLAKIGENHEISVFHSKLFIEQSTQLQFYIRDFGNSLSFLESFEKCRTIQGSSGVKWPIF